VFDLNGGIISSDSVPIHYGFQDNATEFDASVAWNDICRLTRGAAKRCSKLHRRIVSVSSTSMREGNVFYDKHGVELLAVPNLDFRATSEAAEVQVSLGETIYEKSGHWPSAIFLINRLNW